MFGIMTQAAAAEKWPCRVSPMGPHCTLTNRFINVFMNPFIMSIEA
jgi:hypothetical protein